MSTSARVVCPCGFESTGDVDEALAAFQRHSCPHHVPQGHRVTTWADVARDAVLWLALLGLCALCVFGGVLR